MQRTCSVFIGKERIEILRLGSRHRGWDMPWAQSLVTVFLGFRRKKFKGYRGSIDIEQCGIRKYIAGNPVYGFAWACDGGYILPWGYFSRRKAETGQPLCSPYFKFPVCNLAFKRRPVYFSFVYGRDHRVRSYFDRQCLYRGGDPCCE